MGPLNNMMNRHEQTGKDDKWPDQRLTWMQPDIISTRDKPQGVSKIEKQIPNEKKGKMIEIMQLCKSEDLKI